MTFFQLATLFVCLVAVGGWVNARSLRLPHGVAMLGVGLLGALVLVGLQMVEPTVASARMVVSAIEGLSFSQTVLGYLLGFLLFAGAMQVDVSELRRRTAPVLTLATVGVAASTAIVGFGIWLLAGWLGLSVSLPWALVFGALISPTDPVAVLASLREGELATTLRIILQGEALFNDGVAIVVFTALLSFATGAHPSAASAVVQVFVQAAGGLALGLIAATVVTRAMRMIDDYVVEVSLSIALAMAVFAGAQALGLSGPIAAVGAGLLIGNSRSDDVLSQTSREHLTNFWKLIDVLLGALLFLLLGLELLVVRVQAGDAALAAAAIGLVLFARLVVILPWGAYYRLRREEKGANTILVWGGLHGALSLALALSLPDGPARSVLLPITYAVSVFSVAAQGLTFRAVAVAVTRR